jgi:hypothetical protein
MKLHASHCDTFNGSAASKAGNDRSPGVNSVTVQICICLEMSSSGDVIYGCQLHLWIAGEINSDRVERVTQLG